MLSVHPSYSSKVSKEDVEQIYKVTGHVRNLKPQVMEVSDTCEKMLALEPQARRKVELAVEAAHEAVRALAVLETYLDAVLTELA